MSAQHTPGPLRPPKGWTVEGACDLLLLVGYEIDPAAVADMPVPDLLAAEKWAAKTHLRASDNPVRVPPRPAWLPEPWRGPDDGLWGPGPTKVDRAAIAAARGEA